MLPRYEPICRDLANAEVNGIRVRLTGFSALEPMPQDSI